MPSRITVCLISNKSPNPNFSRQIWMLVFIGLIALPLNSLWVIDTGVTGHGINFTRVSLFMNAICVIFVLGLINPLLKRYAAKFSLTSRDMVLIYAMICVWGPRYHPALVSHHRIRILFRNSGERLGATLPPPHSRSARRHRPHSVTWILQGSSTSLRQHVLHPGIRQCVDCTVPDMV